jgi:hypothetical protein
MVRRQLAIAQAVVVEVHFVSIGAILAASADIANNELQSNKI